MIGLIQFAETGKVSKKNLRGLMQESYFQMAFQWHKRFAAKHFTKQGAREYEYESRVGEKGGANFKKTYTGRKKKKFGHTLPLVFTGKSRDRILAFRDIRANSRRGKAVLNAPTLNFIPVGGSINLFQEATRVSDPEMSTIEGIGNDTLSEQISKLKTKEKQKVA